MPIASPTPLPMPRRIRRVTLLFGCLLMTILAAATTVRADDPQPTGASAAWTSTDPVIRRAVALVREGKLADAERLLAAEGSDLSEASAVARTELVEVIRRTRRDYALDAAEMLERVRASIPDATADDVERWRASGALQHRVIDGQPRFFRREPGNLFRFDAGARQRRDAHAAAATRPSADAAQPTTHPTTNAATRPATAPAAPAFVLEEHLAEVIAAAKATGSREVLPVRHRVTYRITVAPNRSGAKKGSLVRAWLPYPQAYRQQRDVKLIRSSPDEPLVAPPGNAADPSAGAPQRSVHFEQWIEDPSRPVTFEAEFEYTISAYCPQLDDAEARPLSPEKAKEFASFLAERPPHIAFTPRVRQIVNDVAGDEPNPLVRARKLFYWIDEHVPWAAEEEYSIIPSLSAHGLANGRGDCGVQGMLFITLCRAAGIPARWQSGWQTRPGRVNLHDWAEFFVEPWGWLPADPSYGVQRQSEVPEIRDFYLGHLDAYRMIVNLDYGRPLYPPTKSFRSEPADFQRGEVELDGRNLYFDEWDYEMDIQWTPLTSNGNGSPATRPTPTTAPTSAPAQAPTPTP